MQIFLLEKKISLPLALARGVILHTELITKNKHKRLAAMYLRLQSMCSEQDYKIKTKHTNSLTLSHIFASMSIFNNSKVITRDTITFPFHSIRL